MKDLTKNPLFYYVLVPALVALWPLLLWAAFLPRAQGNIEDGKEDYKKARAYVLEILGMAPERLALADDKNARAEFDYATAITEFAREAKMTAADYKLNSGLKTSHKGQDIQNATVSLKKVRIKQASGFLEKIQFRWSDLECTSLSLRTLKDDPDNWDAEIKFKYYF